MIFLFYLMFKWTVKLCIGVVWLYWAVIALTVALILSLAGRDRAARQWQRSLRWRRVF